MNEHPKSWQYYLQGIGWSYVVMLPGILLVLLFAFELKEDGKFTFRPKDVPDSVIWLAVSTVGMGMGIRANPKLAGKVLPDSRVLETIGRVLVESRRTSEKENGVGVSSGEDGSDKES